MTFKELQTLSESWPKNDIITVVIEEIDRIGKLVDARLCWTEKEKEERSLIIYKTNLRKYYDEHKDEICRDYRNWLEEKIYDNDVPVKE